jgi:hypothetical protein
MTREGGCEADRRRHKGGAPGREDPRIMDQCLQKAEPHAGKEGQAWLPAGSSDHTVISSGDRCLVVSDPEGEERCSAPVLAPTC